MALAGIGISLLIFATSWFGIEDKWMTDYFRCAGTACGACFGVDITAPFFGLIGAVCVMASIIILKFGDEEPTAPSNITKIARAVLEDSAMAFACLLVPMVWSLS